MAGHCARQHAQRHDDRAVCDSVGFGESERVPAAAGESGLGCIFAGIDEARRVLDDV